MENDRSNVSGMVIAFNKPFGVVAEARLGGTHRQCLAACQLPAGVRIASGLARDSEGLLLLTDEPEIHDQLLKPAAKFPHVYWVQVERIPTEATLNRLQKGVSHRGQIPPACRAWLLAIDPDMEPLTSGERNRRIVPMCWLGFSVIETSDRQIRQLTADVGHPTVRLMRLQIGTFALGELPLGKWRALTPAERRQLIGEQTALGSPWRYRKPQAHPLRA